MSLSRLTDPKAVEAALDECDRLGRGPFLRKYGFNPARGYHLIERENRYDSKAIAGVAFGYQFPDEGPLKAAIFTGGEKTVQRKLTELGFTVEGPKDGIGGERSRRETMLNALLEKGGMTGVRPHVLRAIGIYGGAQGIWVDQKRTGPLTSDGTGIAVGVLHTGIEYVDDLSDDGIIYHYPETNRGRKDDREIQALKNAEGFQLSVFVITQSDTPNLRDVKVGWAIDHDDASRQCIILFEEPPKALPPDPDEIPFRLSASRKEKKRSGKQRERSPEFQFDVIKRYGQQCAFCEIKEARLLEAAHIRPVSKNGSDDPRNGLVLCANHHKAIDNDLVGIRPSTLELIALNANTPLTSLGVTRPSISHLGKKPHPDALRWKWAKLEERDV